MNNSNVFYIIYDFQNKFSLEYTIPSHNPLDSEGLTHDIGWVPQKLTLRQECDISGSFRNTK